MHLIIIFHLPPMLLTLGPPCLGEMTAVMACWKLHSFNDVQCRKEIEAFNTCSREVVSLHCFLTLPPLARLHSSQKLAIFLASCKYKFRNRFSSHLIEILQIPKFCHFSSYCMQKNWIFATPNQIKVARCTNTFMM